MCERESSIEQWKTALDVPLSYSTKHYHAAFKTAGNHFEIVPMRPLFLQNFENPYALFCAACCRSVI